MHCSDAQSQSCTKIVSLSKHLRTWLYVYASPTGLVDSDLSYALDRLKKPPVFSLLPLTPNKGRSNYDSNLLNVLPQHQSGVCVCARVRACFLIWMKKKRHCLVCQGRVWGAVNHLAMLCRGPWDMTGSESMLLSYLHAAPQCTSCHKHICLSVFIYVFSSFANFLPKIYKKTVLVPLFECVCVSSYVPLPLGVSVSRD